MDWALKRVLKFVLKKSIGPYLQSEPDLEQLDVQLSSGTFELRNVLLNCDIVNQQLDLPGWRITAGYVGLVRGSLPLLSSAAGTAAAAAAPGGLAAANGNPGDPRANLILDEVLTSGVLLSYDVSGRHTNHLSVKCYKLECYEYLPGSWLAADRQLTGLSPAELGSVPRAVVAPGGPGGAGSSSQQDVAVRCEPRSDTPTSHNSSRMAAAFVLEGAHWALTPEDLQPAASGAESLSVPVLLDDFFHTPPAAAAEGALSAAYLLPIDPSAPKPITRLTCKGLSGMFVLHDRGSVITSGPQGSGSSRRRGRHRRCSNGSSAGRLEVEVDGVSLQLEILPPAAAIVLETVRPDPAQLDMEEYRLGLALLPLRLRLNQDVIAFLVTFCGSVSVSVDYCPRTVDIAALRDGDFLELLNLVPWGGVDLALKPLRFNGLVGWDGLAAAAAQEWMSHIGRTQAHKFLTGVAPIRSVVKVGGAVAALLAGPAASLQDAVGDVVLAATRSVAAGVAAAQAGSSNGGLVCGSSAARQLQERLRVAAAAAAAAAGRAAGVPGRGVVGGSSDAVASRLQQAMQQSSAGFARMLLYEALGAGATVAAGAELLLAGSSGTGGSIGTRSSSSGNFEAPGTAGEPAGLVEGLRAAAGELQGGFKTAAEALVGAPVRGYQAGDYPTWQAAAAEAFRAAPAAAAAPAKGLAAAARTALLGAQKAVGGAQQQ
eukprot:gene9269-9434_t